MHDGGRNSCLLFEKYVRSNIGNCQAEQIAGLAAAKLNETLDGRGFCRLFGGILLPVRMSAEPVLLMFITIEEDHSEKGGTPLRAFWIAISMLMAVLTAAPAQASSLLFDSGNSSRTRTIGADPGGKIITYALKVIELRRQKTIVRFSGPCNSACTLHLSLAGPQTCLLHGASFGFHLPYGVPPTQAQVARDYLLQRYPEWVRMWLASKGGLTAELKTMPYDYARQHMRQCGHNDV
ncbi:MAG TPA: hypothetical protein VN112_16625 [Ensifer sp.]|nr:hypothetical protein [Ensifer sp.]